MKAVQVNSDTLSLIGKEIAPELFETIKDFYRSIELHNGEFIYVIVDELEGNRNKHPRVFGWRIIVQDFTFDLNAPPWGVKDWFDIYPKEARKIFGNRLSGHEFCEKIKLSPCWKLTFDNINGYYELTVVDYPNAEQRTYLGPDPMLMNGKEFDYFVGAVEEITTAAMRRSEMMKRLMERGHNAETAGRPDPAQPGDRTHI